MHIPQFVRPHLPGRAIDDVEREMREQDVSAAKAQRNLIIAIVACVGLAVLSSVRGLDGGVALFVGTAVVLVVAFGVLALVRRSIHRRFG